MSNVLSEGRLQAALVQGTDGIFYGTAADGGSGANGTIFSLWVGLGPFVKTLPRFGKAGAAIKILGNNLSGKTSVTFNVPAGATSGTVQAVTL